MFLEWKIGVSPVCLTFGFLGFENGRRAIFMALQLFFISNTFAICLAPGRVPPIPRPGPTPDLEDETK